MTIAIQREDQLEVYASQDGTIVLKQERFMEEDSVVMFHPSFADAVIAAIRQAVEESSNG